LRTSASKGSGPRHAERVCANPFRQQTARHSPANRPLLGIGLHAIGNWITRETIGIIEPRHARADQWSIVQES